MHILITGPIGCGKTTHAVLLAEDLQATLIKTGDLIRQEAVKNTSKGKLVRHYMTHGHMVPDDVMAELLQIAIKDASETIILDSYPRRLSQLKIYDPGIDTVIYLNISDDALEERLLKRGRVDDRPEVIENRLRVYHQETVPLLKYYQDQGRLITIDASGTIEEVQEKIRSHFQIKSNTT
jgi:adenylate kinase